MFRRILLLLVPISILANALRLGPQIVFVAAFLALIPLASLLAEATEELAIRTGPRIGGLLNATLGTMTELIIMFALLRSGQIHLLKASIVGSILISLLFTVGVAVLLGGIRNGMQRLKSFFASPQYPLICARPVTPGLANVRTLYVFMISLNLRLWTIVFGRGPTTLM